MQVWVKVSQVQDDGGPPKVSCSMKQVSQENGADLDSQNTMGARRGHPGFQGPASEAPPEVRRPPPFHAKAFSLHRHTSLC